MKNRRRLIAVTLLSCVCCAAIPSTATAGPMFDWLFHRNRSQGLTSTTAGYAPAYGNAVSAAPSPSPSYTKPCLFGCNRASRANQVAARPNPAATTAGYAPQGSCGAGWCQQTVVKYVPQIAYRTAYQPVPVTTYKTSTTINPANGLPRTCTRPCTSYSYQARRVPYTTYRPVYTTVPVSDTLGQTANYGQRPAQAAPVQAAPNYAYQPPTSPGCSSCQNGAAGGYGAPAGGYGGAPGYTPGNAQTFPQATPWSSNPVAPPGGDGYAPRGATPWQARPSEGFGTTRDPAGATEWQRTGDGYRAPPQGNGSAADIAPSLRPDYGDDQDRDTYGYSDPPARTDRLKPVPIPESIRRRLNGTGRSSFRPYESSTDRDRGADQTRNERNRQSDRGFTSPPPQERRMFSTPDRSQPLEYGVRPELEPPSNQDAFDFDETRRQQFRSRAVRDLERDNDKTARRSQTVRRKQIDSPRATRYTAVPIDWSQNDTRRHDRRESGQTTSTRSLKRPAWKSIR